MSDLWFLVNALIPMCAFVFLLIKDEGKRKALGAINPPLLAFLLLIVALNVHRKFSTHAVSGEFLMLLNSIYSIYLFLMLSHLILNRGYFLKIPGESK